MRDIDIESVLGMLYDQFYLGSRGNTATRRAVLRAMRVIAFGEQRTTIDTEAVFKWLKFRALEESLGEIDPMLFVYLELAMPAGDWGPEVDCPRLRKIAEEISWLSSDVDGISARLDGSGRITVEQSPVGRLTFPPGTSRTPGKIFYSSGSAVSSASSASSISSGLDREKINAMLRKAVSSSSASASAGYWTGSW